jgi:hypothetical protein
MGNVGKESLQVVRVRQLGGRGRALFGCRSHTRRAVERVGGSKGRTYHRFGLAMMCPLAVP